ncbi:hypothetical protein F8M41_010094 [Gigaspora margarita]|uniref:Uncharacterized protein n=1 Tax=Gigaspora margarita TaxID=4874 RepID=A0A8H4AUR6_GIGMA|nr:hypothetical protein F8M41_010094 [Gigaspora margarita]
METLENKSIDNLEDCIVQLQDQISAYQNNNNSYLNYDVLIKKLVHNQFKKSILKDSIMNNENDNCRFYYLDFFKKKLTLKYDDKESDNEHDKHHNEEHKPSQNDDAPELKEKNKHL